MKKISIILSLLLILCLFSSCSPEKETASSFPNTSTDQSPSISSPSAEQEDVIALPDHLYQTTKMQSSSSLRYDFKITQPTSLHLNVSTQSGKMSIGVRDKKSGSYVLDLTECTQDSCHQIVALEQPGQYSIVIQAANHTGSYEVIGTPLNETGKDHSSKSAASDL